MLDSSKISYQIKTNKSIFFVFLILSFFAVLIESYNYCRAIGIIGTIGLIYVIIYHVRQLIKHQRDLGITIFLIGILFWFFKEIFIMSTSNILFENIANYSPFFSKQIPINLLSISIFCIGIFNYFGYFFWDFFKKVKFSKKLFFIKRYPKNSTFVDIFLMLISFSGWIPFYKQFGSIKQSIIQLLLFRDVNIEIEPSLANYLPIVSIMAASFALIRIITNQGKFKSLNFLTFVAGAVIAILSGTRFKVIFLLLPAILVIITIQSKKFTLKKKVFFLSFMCVLLFGVSFYQIVNRNSSSSSFIENNISSSTNGGDHFTALTHAVAISEDLNSYFYQPMFILFASDFIPRMFWKNKPDSLFWEYYNNRLAESGNITPSILGQYYLNWGILGIFITAFNFGLWCRITDYLLEYYKQNNSIFHLWLSVVIITFIFLSFRVYSLNYFFYVIISGFFGWFFTRYNRK
jgi:oligosaccharide repeat unit polymerase